MAVNVGNLTELTDNDDNYYGDNNDEELKKHLVREVARLIKDEKSVMSIWPKLKDKTSFDCEALWNEMQESTEMKLMCSLDANDLLQDIPPSMRLSASNWLQFDLVLVHEGINVVNCKALPQCIWDLWQLVQDYNVEQLVGNKLAEAWIHITLQYNKGGRQCSPMCLQLRWYQLKKWSRQQVFQPDIQLRQDITKLLHSIAIKYQKIVTHIFPKWESLVKEKRVILPETFMESLKQNEAWKHIKSHERWYVQANKEVLNTINTIKDDSRPESIAKVINNCPDVEIKDDNPKHSKSMNVNEDRLGCNPESSGITNLLNGKSNVSIDTSKIKTKRNTAILHSKITYTKKNNDIDPKLLMEAIVYTKKLDSMKVFRRIKYNFVNDKKVTQCALVESKPTFQRN